MKTCEQTQLIHAYHDGELSAERAALAEAHVRECTACAAELAELRAMTAKVRFAARPTLSAAGLARLHERVDVQVKAGEEAVAFRMATWLTAAAAAIAIACTAYLMFGAGGIKQTPPGVIATTSSWETTAMLAIADARGGSASGEYKLQQFMIDDLSGSTSGVEDSHD